MEEPLLINHAGKQFFPWMNWLVLGLDYRLDLVQLLEVKWVKEKLMGLLVVIEAGITVTGESFLMYLFQNVIPELLV